jgi:uncharacterized protein (TIGR03083 family)
MEADPRPWLAELRSSHERLVGLVARLGPEQLLGPSYCDDWSVAQVLSHLGSGAEIFGLMAEAAARGEPPVGQERFAAIWDRWNAMPPDVQASEAIPADRRFVETLEGLGDDLDRITIDVMGRDLGATEFLSLRLSEHTLHSWDIAVTVDPAAVLAPGAVNLVIDRVPALGGFLGRAAAGGGDHFTAHVRTIGPERNYTVSVGDAVEITDVGHAPENGGPVIELPSEAFIRLVYGRLDRRHLPPAVVGDPEAVELVDRLRAAFPGI